MGAQTVTTPAWQWMATGTTWHIHHSGGVSAEAAQAVAAGVEFDEARWSRFRPQSTVARINRNAGIPVQVDPETLELLIACRRWTQHTQGLFQPLVGAALEAWGYARSIHEHVPGAARSPAGVPVEGDLEIDTDAQSVRIPAGTRLDLGGIAKSWMARRAAATVAELSDDGSLLVDAGGDLTAVRGSHLVAVEAAGLHPQNVPGTAPGATGCWVELAAGEGIATSGSGRRRWVNHDGSVAHHLIDPFAGRPGAEAHATVIACDVVTADVQAKVLALAPEVLPTPAAAIRTSGGTCVTTPGWDRRVVA